MHNGVKHPELEDAFTIQFPRRKKRKPSAAEKRQRKSDALTKSAQEAVSATAVPPPGGAGGQVTGPANGLRSPAGRPDLVATYAEIAGIPLEGGASAMEDYFDPPPTRQYSGPQFESELPSDPVLGQTAATGLSPGEHVTDDPDFDPEFDDPPPPDVAAAATGAAKEAEVALGEARAETAADAALPVIGEEIKKTEVTRVAFVTAMVAGDTLALEALAKADVTVTLKEGEKVFFEIGEDGLFVPIMGDPTRDQQARIALANEALWVRGTALEFLKGYVNKQDDAAALALNQNYNEKYQAWVQALQTASAIQIAQAKSELDEAKELVILSAQAAMMINLEDVKQEDREELAALRSGLQHRSDADLAKIRGIISGNWQITVNNAKISREFEADFGLALQASDIERKEMLLRYALEYFNSLTLAEKATERNLSTAETLARLDAELKIIHTNLTAGLDSAHAEMMLELTHELDIELVDHKSGVALSQAEAMIRIDRLHLEMEHKEQFDQLRRHMDEFKIRLTGGAEDFFESEGFEKAMESATESWEVFRNPDLEDDTWGDRAATALARITYPLPTGVNWDSAAGDFVSPAEVGGLPRERTERVTKYLLHLKPFFEARDAARDSLEDYKTYRLEISSQRIIANNADKDRAQSILDGNIGSAEASQIVLDQATTELRRLETKLAPWSILLQLLGNPTMLGFARHTGVLEELEEILGFKLGFRPQGYNINVDTLSLEEYHNMSLTEQSIAQSEWTAKHGGSEGDFEDYLNRQAPSAQSRPGVFTLG
jgi:hypothetical protein